MNRIKTWYSHLKKNQIAYIPYAILIIAVLGMLGSLYYSNFGDPVANIKLLEPFPINAGLLPCRLCWYARILLYPIVPLMLIAIWKRDHRFSDYVLPLAALGMPLEMYHYTIQFLPKSINLGNCDLIKPCNVIDVSYFHFITIPFLAFIAFATITALCLKHRKHHASQSGTPTQS